MSKRHRYQKKAVITAVQLNLDTDAFYYQKWGGQQRCKPGDWLVESEGDCYTIDRESFAQTYEQLSPGCYRKTTVVWAEVATESGTISTKEGSTDYLAGDYLVSNNEDGSDDYAIAKAVFERAYISVAND